MKLKYKAWALVLIIFGVGVGGSMLGVSYIVGESFDRLEHERAEREGERARRVFNQQHQTLAASARDYSYWVDTVQFLAGARPNFMTENFDAESMGYLGISELMFFDVRGQLHASLVRDEEGGRPEVAGDRVAAFGPLALSLLAKGDVKQVLQTLRVADGQLELVAASVVHAPDEPNARGQGVVVMVRLLTRRNWRACPRCSWHPPGSHSTKKTWRAQIPMWCARMPDKTSCTPC